MAQLLNYRNALLQAATQRVIGSAVVVTSGAATSLNVPKGSNTTVPGTITLTASVTKFVLPAYAWYYKKYEDAAFTPVAGQTLPTLDVVGDLAFLTANLDTSAVQYKVIVTETGAAYPNTSEYTVTIPILRDGTDSTLGFLTNEAVSVPANEVGVVPANVYSSLDSTLVIYRGTVDDSANWSATISAYTPGITAALVNGKTISITNITPEFNSGYVEIVATRQNYANIVKRLSIAKVATGISPTIYSIEPNVYAIAKNPDGTYNPAAVTFFSYSVTGSTKTAYMGRINIYHNDSATPAYVSQDPEAVKTYTIPIGISTLRVELLSNGSPSAVLDSQTMPVAEAGSSSVDIIVTNSTFVIPANANNDVLSYINSGTNITVREGTNPLVYRNSLLGQASSFTVGTATLSTGSGITVGSVSAGSDGSTVATILQHSNMLQAIDSIIITYPVTYIRANGSQATEYVTQSITKGVAGYRGSRNVYGSDPSYTATYDYDGVGITAPGAESYAKKATDLIYDATVNSSPRTPIEGDTVTFSNNSNYVYTITYKANTSSWTPPGTVIDGNLLVTGSITADKLDTRELTIRDAAGNIVVQAGTPIDWTKLGTPSANLTGLGYTGALDANKTYIQNGILYGLSSGEGTAVSNALVPANSQNVVTRPWDFSASAGWNTMNGFVSATGQPDHLGTNLASTVDLSSTSWDLYKHFTDLGVGATYRATIWYKLGTATNFCVNVNNSAAVRTGELAVGTSTTWAKLSVKITTNTGKINLHLGSHDEIGAQQSDGTVHIGYVELVDVSASENQLLVPSINTAATTASWSGVYGSGKPQDGATVGAVAGVNLTDAAGMVISTDSIRNNLVNLDWWKRDAAIPWLTNSEYNRIIQVPTDCYVQGPRGGSDHVWYCQEVNSDGEEGASGGGWENVPISLDNTKAYRFVVPMRKVTAGGTAWFGLRGVCALNTVDSSNWNPYFVGSFDGLLVDRWHLFVGYVYPYGSTGNTNDGAGVWDCKTGQKVADGSNWNFGPSGEIQHRAYQFYGPAGAAQLFGRPMVNLVDGTEPSLREYFEPGALLNTDIKVVGGTLSGIGTSGVVVDNSYQSIGQNLIPNSDQTQTKCFDGLYNPSNANLVVFNDYASNHWGVESYTLPGSTTRNLASSQLGEVAGGPSEVAFDTYPTGGWGRDYGIPVVAGQRYIFSCYMASHRCSFAVGIGFWDAAGNNIGYAISPNTTSVEGATNTLQNYARPFVAAVAPSGAVAVTAHIRKNNTAAGGDSYVWYAAPMLEAVAANAQGPSPYMPGPASSTRQLGYAGDLNANNTRVEGGVIQGVSSGAGTPVANSLIGINSSGELYGAGAGNGIKISNNQVTLSADGTLNGAGGGKVTLDGMGVSNFRVVSTGYVATTQPTYAGLYNANTGAALVGAANMYRVVKIRRSDNAVFDVGGWNTLAGGSNPSDMAAALNAIGSDHIVVVFTYDEPQGNRLSNGLAEAMYRCGASRAIYGSPNFKSRSAYALIGIPGCGEGNGAEFYQGDVDSSPNSWIDASFSVVKGNLVGVSGSYTPKSLTDYGYVGDLNATAGAPTGTYVGGVLAETVASNSALAGGALQKAGDTITGRITMNVADGLFAGTDLDNGVYMGSGGLVGKNAGKPTFAIDTAGNASFGGTLNVSSAASGARMEIKNNVIKVYDSNGVLRVQIGDLTV